MMSNRGASSEQSRYIEVRRPLLPHVSVISRRTFLQAAGGAVATFLSGAWRGVAVSAQANAEYGAPETLTREQYQAELDARYPDTEVVYIETDEELQEFYLNALKSQIEELDFTGAESKQEAMLESADILHNHSLTNEELLDKMRTVFTSVWVDQRSKQQHRDLNLEHPAVPFWTAIYDPEQTELVNNLSDEDYEIGLEAMRRVCFDFIGSELNHPVRSVQYTVSWQALEASREAGDDTGNRDLVDSLKAMVNIMNEGLGETEITAAHLKRIIVMDGNHMRRKEHEALLRSLIEVGGDLGVEDDEQRAVANYKPYYPLTDTSSQMPGNPITGFDPADVVLLRYKYRYLRAGNMSDNLWLNTAYARYVESLDQWVDFGEFEELVHVLLGLPDDYRYTLRFHGSRSGFQDRMLSNFSQNWRENPSLNYDGEGHGVPISLDGITFDGKGFHAMNGRLSLRNLITAATFLNAEDEHRVHGALSPFREQDLPLSTMVDGVLETSHFPPIELNLTAGEKYIREVRWIVGDQNEAVDVDTMMAGFELAEDGHNWRFNTDRGEVSAEINNQVARLVPDEYKWLMPLDSSKYLVIEDNDGNTYLLPTQILRDLKPGYQTLGGSDRYLLGVNPIDIDQLRVGDFWTAYGESNIPVGIDFEIMTEEEIGRARAAYQDDPRNRSITEQIAAPLDHNSNSERPELLLYSFRLPHLKEEVREMLGIESDVGLHLVAKMRRTA